MKLFYLERKVDISGTSGVGRVAEGVIFDDGVCALRWVTANQHHSTAIYDSIEDVKKIHGHGAATDVIVYNVVVIVPEVKL